MSPFDPEGRRAVAAALESAVPGSVELGALDYVECLLTAFDHEPPRIWAAPGEWAGPAGDPGPDAPAWLDLGPWERQAWQQRIADWASVYGRVVAGTADEADLRVVHAHACEATYGDPAYGGNRDGAGWARIGFPEPLHPPAGARRR
ncbi:MAG: hypothetical protein KGR17_09990 [Acidobacteria bacterium]|nr:hypothetical protein [Acidobacteriota bacterium]